jgi:hypothetical protein
MATTPAISLGEARSQLSAWLTASRAIAAGQSYSIGNRSLTRANAQYIKEQIEFWEGRVNILASGSSGPRAFRVVPRDL